MSPDDPDLLALVAAISDGEEVDWDAAVTGGVEGRRALIRSLRIVAQVGDLHRSIPDQSGSRARTSPPLPREIGHYRILRLIAEGGMGMVYEAEQDRPRRTVALKVIRPGCASPSALMRFERESQVLARLQHPGIAQIYEAGTADFGFGSQPFFAMEMVRGEPLMRHAEERSLSTNARIELLARVADAVEHAHGKGVIHRDLKPANILVDEAGQPKVLDFGVARATDSDMQATLGTDIGQLVGTLPYMSPEQVAGDPARVDARSDVYSLGVVLCELLTGRRPYELSGKAIPEVMHIIREQEPRRLSSVDKAFRGDVETIAAKALEKGQERRYQSAADLAQDLRCYLRREPIAARQPTALYQLRKFARRRPELVVGMVSVFVVLTAGIVGTSAGMVRATRQANLADSQRVLAEASRKTAERESQKALRLNSFMQDLLAAARPGVMGASRDIKFVDVLQRAAMDLPVRFKDEPELEMQARSSLGQTYVNLGLYDEAIAILDRALELARRYRPEDAEDRLVIADRLAWAMGASGQGSVKSEELARPSLAVARRALGPAHPCTLSLMNTLSFALVAQWKLEEAEQLLNELLPALRAIQPEQRVIPIAAVKARLAHIRGFRGDSVGGRELAREALAEAEGDKASALANLCQRTTVTAIMILKSLDNMEETEQRLRRALAESRRTFGRDHQESVRTGEQLALLLAQRNKPGEALDLWRESLAYGRAHSWDRGAWKDHNVWGVDWLLSTMGKLAAFAGRGDEGAAYFDEAISIRRREHGDDDPLCKEIWRDRTMLLGLGSEGPWASEAIRTQVRRVVSDSLKAHPTRTLAPDEVQWDRLRFGLSRWAPQAGMSAGPGGLQSVVEGDLPRLKSLPEPESGLYLFGLDVPRTGSASLHESTWMLVAPWSLEIYQADLTHGNGDDAWRRRLASAPDERRREPALSLEGWWRTGFGPSGEEYNFGIVATTTVDLPAGAYRFLVTANDGARLWIDDHLEIDSWKTRDTTTDAAVVQLSDGPHKVRLDYFQVGGVSLLWVRAEPLDYRAGEARTTMSRGAP